MSGRLHLAETDGAASSEVPVGVAGARHVPVLAGQDRLLVDNREPQVETFEREAVKPAVDHVGGAPALADGPRDVRGAVHDVAGSEDAWDLSLERFLAGCQGAVPVALERAGKGDRRRPTGRSRR